MKEIIEFDNRTVEIWRRPRQRYINLRVRPDGWLRVTCNRRVPKGEIFTFIREQEDFIVRGLSELAEHARKYPLKKYESGETFLIGGSPIALQVIWSWDKRVRVEIADSEIQMVAPLTSTRDERRKALFKFLSAKAKPYLLERMLALSTSMCLIPRSVKVRGQKTRWGSCSARGEISLNWKLLAAPVEVIDYVLVHEIAHLRHLNHSPKFWDLVQRHFPQMESARRWLREHETEITRQFR